MNRRKRGGMECTKQVKHADWSLCPDPTDFFDYCLDVREVHNKLVVSGKGEKLCSASCTYVRAVGSF